MNIAQAKNKSIKIIAAMILSVDHLQFYIYINIYIYANATPNTFSYITVHDQEL